MRVEIPELKRCCCCIPLRYGILTWGYIVLIQSILVILMLIFTTVKYLRRRELSLEGIIIITTMGTVFTLVFIFQLILIIGAHKKNYKVLRVHYRASVVGAVATGIVLVLNFGHQCYWLTLYLRYVKNPLEFCIIMSAETFLNVIFLVFQIYLILVVRSEILKLKGLHSFRFVNTAAEAEGVASEVECLECMVEDQKTFIKRTE